jgi:hypothetical protein
MIPTVASVDFEPDKESRMFEVVSGGRRSPLVALALEQSKHYHPYLYRLKDIPWVIFGTLTWSQSSKRQGTDAARQFREYDFDGLILRTKRFFNLRNLDYYHCTETNAVWGQHYHFLIGTNGTEKIPPAILAETMRSIWTMGRADIQPYDTARQLAGVKYCLEREFDERGIERERDDRISFRLLKRLKRRSKADDSQCLAPETSGITGGFWGMPLRALESKVYLKLFYLNEH